MFNLDFLIQLSEKDKRIIVALFILLILIFVLVAYVAQGIKALMRNYAKGIDGYMHELCSAKLVDNPKDFRKQVFKKESKVLYQKTRWVFRIFILSTVGFVIYTLIAKPGGEATPFGYVGESLNSLLINFDCPKGEFFGIKNFPIDWPYVASWPSPKFDIASIVTYLSLIGYAYAIVVFFNNIVGFIGKLLRANEKSKDVFAKDLDEFKVEDESFKSLDNLSGTDLDGE